MAVDQATLATQMTAAIAAVNATIATIGSMQEDSPVVLQTVYAAITNARTAFDAAIAAFEADIDQTSVGSVIVGVPAPILAANLLNQASDVNQESLVIVAESYLLRCGANIQAAPG